MYCFTRYLLRTVKVASGRILPVVERQTWSCRKALYLSPQYSIVCVSSSSPALSVENGLKKYKIEIKMPLLEGTFDQETATEYLSNLNEEEKKRLKLYKLEYELWMSSGLPVPYEMRDEWWAQILYSCHTISSRKKIYIFFKKLEHHKRVKIEKSKKAQQLNLEKSDSLNDKKSTYTIFLRLIRATQNKHWHARCAQSMIFGRPFVVDMSYESYMSNKETVSFINQLLDGYGSNHRRIEPCDLVLTNFDKSGFVFKKICYMHDSPDCLFAKISEQSYLDLFPKKRLVYLTPDAEDDLLEDDEDNIYIIGGLVDAKDNKPLSYARAKKDNIRSARLPIDRYLIWKKGSKSLAINHTIEIMTEFMRTKDWKKAFSCVPQRKLMTEQDIKEIEFRRPRHFKRSRNFDNY